MTSKEKTAVKEHINKTAGWNENSKGYQAIHKLFDKSAWYLSFEFEPNLYIEIAHWLQKIGLEVEIRSGSVKMDDDALIKYYENVMGIKAQPREPEKSYYERYNIGTKEDK